MEGRPGRHFIAAFVALLLGLSFGAMGGHDLERAAHSPETGFHPLRGKILIAVGIVALLSCLGSLFRFVRDGRRSR